MLDYSDYGIGPEGEVALADRESERRLAILEECDKLDDNTLTGIVADFEEIPLRRRLLTGRFYGGKNWEERERYDTAKYFLKQREKRRSNSSENSQ